MNPLTYADFAPVAPAWGLACPDWVLWLTTDGEKGEEPPEDLKRIEELRQQALADPDEEKRVALTVEMAKIFEKNFWVLGGVNIPTRGYYRIANNALRNVPDNPPDAGELLYDIPAQLFFRK